MIWKQDDMFVQTTTYDLFVQTTTYDLIRAFMRIGIYISWLRGGSIGKDLDSASLNWRLLPSVEIRSYWQMPWSSTQMAEDLNITFGGV